MQTIQIRAFFLSETEIYEHSTAIATKKNKTCKNKANINFRKHKVHWRESISHSTLLCSAADN